MTDVNAHSLDAAAMNEAAAERPLHIAGVDPERGFAGGETQVLGLTRELLRIGHRAELICDPSGRLFERARGEGITCHPLRLRNSVDVAGAMRLRSIMAREQFDIVHFHTSRAHAMAPFVHGLARALVVTRRMDYRPNRLFGPYLYSRAVDGVAAISRGVTDALVEAGIPRERIRIIPSGVDCDYFRPPNADEMTAAREALDVAPDTIAIGTVGVLEERKGHRHLLEAVARTGCRELRCFIAGDGSLRPELERLAGTLGIADRTRFLGQVEGSRALLWALDIFVFPSLWEGLGVAAIEAAACGLATVGSNAGGIAEVVSNGETGIIVPAGDSGALGEAIARLAASPADRAAMGAAARSRAVKMFAMSTMARRTLALYRECLQTRKGRT